MIHLHGVNTTPHPMSATEGIDYLEADMIADGKERFNLIYLDFFGQPDNTHCELLDKIFGLRMLDKRSSVQGRNVLLIRFHVCQIEF